MSGEWGMVGEQGPEVVYPLTPDPTTEHLSQRSWRLLGGIALLAALGCILEYVLAVRNMSALTMWVSLALGLLFIWSGVWWGMGDRRGWRDALYATGFVAAVGFMLLGAGMVMAVAG